MFYPIIQEAQVQILSYICFYVVTQTKKEQHNILWLKQAWLIC